MDPNAPSTSEYQPMSTAFEDSAPAQASVQIDNPTNPPNPICHNNFIANEIAVPVSGGQVDTEVDPNKLPLNPTLISIESSPAHTSSSTPSAHNSDIKQQSQTDPTHGSTENDSVGCSTPTAPSRSLRVYERWPGRNRFGCGGRVITGPWDDCGPNTCVWLTILIPGDNPKHPM